MQRTVGRQPEGRHSVRGKGVCNMRTGTAAGEEQGQRAGGVHVVQTEDEKKLAAAATLDSSTLPPQPASSSSLAVMII
jgi:hypothetical protein